MDAELEAVDAAFRASPVGQAMLDDQGRFLTVNPTLCSLLQRTEPELLRMTIHDITDPIDRALQNDKFEEMSRSIIDSHQARRRYMRADGSAAHTQVHLTALRDERGHIDRFLLQLTDLSYENLLQETFWLLASYGSDVILRTDVKGIILWISPTVHQTTKWRPEQLMGAPFISLLHPDDRKAALLAHEGSTVGRYRARLLAADGGFHLFEVQVDPLPGQHGQIVGRVATLRICG